MNKKYLNLAEEMIILANQDETDEFLNKLYLVIHLANGNCENPHLDWKEEVENLCKEYNITK